MGATATNEIDTEIENDAQTAFERAQEVVKVTFKLNMKYIQFDPECICSFDRFDVSAKQRQRRR